MQFNLHHIWVTIFSVGSKKLKIPTSNANREQDNLLIDCLLDCTNFIVYASYLKREKKEKLISISNRRS